MQKVIFSFLPILISFYCNAQCLKDYCLEEELVGGIYQNITNIYSKEIKTSVGGKEGSLYLYSTPISLKIYSMHFNYNPYLQLPYNEKHFYLFKENVEKYYGIVLSVVNETNIEKIYRYEDDKIFVTVYLREGIGGLTISSKQLEAVLEEEKENIIRKKRRNAANDF